MVSSKNIGVTQERVLKSINSAIKESNTLAGTGESRKEAKESLKLKQGKVIKFFKGSDKALVELNNLNKKVRCVMLHPMISEDMNISFIPKGIESLDEEYNEYAITPYNPPNCLVMDINNGDNAGEMAIIGFISTDTQKISTNAYEGEIRITVGETIVSITNDRVNIISNGVFWNGVNQKVPVLNNVYEKTETDKTVNTINNNLSAANNNIETIQNQLENLNLENSKSNICLTTNIDNGTEIKTGTNISVTFKDCTTGAVLKDKTAKYLLTRISDGVNKTYTKTTDSNGNLTILIELSAGAYTFEVQFEGDENYKSKYSNPINFTVVAA